MKHHDDELINHEIEVMEGLIEAKAKYRKLIQASIAKWVKDFQDGRIVINNVDDLKKLIEIDLELQADNLKQQTRLIKAMKLKRKEIGEEDTAGGG